MHDARALLSSVLRAVDDADARLTAGGDSLGRVAPAVSRWTARMQIDHAALATASVARAVLRILDGDERCVPPGPPSPHLAAMFAAGAIPRGVAQAPDAMRPAEDARPEDVREHLAECRALLAALDARIGEIRAATMRTPHFALGPMTAAEWLRFGQIHFEHHLAIARDVEAAARD